MPMPTLPGVWAGAGPTRLPGFPLPSYHTKQTRVVGSTWLSAVILWEHCQRLHSFSIPSKHLPLISAHIYRP